MISRAEIKKCGFKPTIDIEFEKNCGWKVYERAIPKGKRAYLHYMDETEGLVQIVVHEEDRRNPGEVLFLGRLATRHVLKVILRATGIA
jgi:hypothetical protein